MTAVVETKKTEKPVFDWADMPAEMETEYTRNTRLDVEKDTPDVIKTRMRESFDRYIVALTEAEAEGKKGPDVSLLWREQSCGTAERAAEFIRLAKRYGRNCDPVMTVYAIVSEQNATVVKYLARVAVTRTRKV